MLKVETNPAMNDLGVLNYCVFLSLIGENKNIRTKSNIISFPLHKHYINTLRPMNNGQLETAEFDAIKRYNHA